MKRTIVFIIIPALAMLFFIAARTPVSVVTPAPEDPATGFPEEVTVLLERSCFDCHSDEASNLKAKSRLNFSKWEDYKLSKKVGKLSDISDEVKGKKMPPKKYVEDYPDRALTDEEITVITTWANAEADRLIEEGE